MQKEELKNSSEEAIIQHISEDPDQGRPIREKER